MKPSRAFLLLLTIVASACATAATIRLPEGPWAPDPLAVEAFESASAGCRGVRTLTAEIAEYGAEDSERVRALAMILASQLAGVLAAAAEHAVTASAPVAEAAS